MTATYHEYEIQSVDAWGNETEGYEYNATYGVEDGVYVEHDSDTAQTAATLMIKALYVFPEKAAEYFYAENIDGENWELRDTKTHCPVGIMIYKRTVEHKPE